MVIIQMGELVAERQATKWLKNGLLELFKAFQGEEGNGAGIIQSRVNSGSDRLSILSLIFHFIHYLYFTLFLRSYTLNMTI